MKLALNKLLWKQVKSDHNSLLKSFEQQVATSRFFDVETFCLEIILLEILWLKILQSRAIEEKLIWKCGNKINPQDISKTICYIALHR